MHLYIVYYEIYFINHSIKPADMIVYMNTAIGINSCYKQVENVFIEKFLTYILKILYRFIASTSQIYFCLEFNNFFKVERNSNVSY